MSRTLLLLLLIIFLTLFFRSLIFLDPDFGWHLKMGEIIFKFGVPKTDQFTFTMPSFPHVDHEWLTDLLVYYLHTLGGFPLLALIYSGIFLATIYLAVGKEVKNKYFHSGLILMTLGVIYPYFGVRHQIFTWFYLAILIKILRNNILFSKFKIYIPLLFLLWANTHGGFIVGLFVLLVLISYEVLLKRLSTIHLFIPLASTLITFINPYGLALWREVFSSLLDARLRWVINEWMPSIWMFDLSMLWFIAFAIMAVWVNRNKFKLSEMFILFVIFVQALMSRRNIPIFVVLSLSFISQSLNLFISEVEKDKISQKRLIVGSKIFLAIVSVITVVQVGLHIYDAIKLKEEVSYPKSALQFIDSNYPSSNIFADYAWGGYIIWKSPSHKIFIDGRMPSWKRKDNPPNESSNAMTEYLEILQGDKSHKDAFNKYGVQVVLMPIQNKKEEIWDKWEKKLRTFLGKDKKDFDFIKALKDDGWIEEYKDDVAVVFTKPSD